jgi:hypothetical protein
MTNGAAMPRHRDKYSYRCEICDTVYQVKENNRYRYYTSLCPAHAYSKMVKKGYLICDKCGGQIMNDGYCLQCGKPNTDLEIFYEAKLLPPKAFGVLG